LALASWMLTFNMVIIMVMNWSRGQGSKTANAASS